jgi:hypothetical protein
MPWYVSAWKRLDTCRDAHGRIIWTAVDAYARRYGLEGHDFERFQGSIDAIEAAERAFQAGKVVKH